MLVINKSSFQLVQSDTLRDETEVSLRGKNQKGRVDFREKDLQIVYDYKDTGMNICTFEVINQFMENFDYHSFEDDFVHDLLNSEILDYQISTYCIKKQEYSLLMATID